MRVAVLSDVHGNLPALDAVLAALGSVDAVWILGDTVGYGPMPDEVVARLSDLGASAVQGNHDAAAIGKLDTEMFNDDARTAIEWTAGRLADPARDWLRGLPERLEQDAFTLVHGSPRDPLWEYCFSVPVARRSFQAFGTSYCLVGHTHIPLAFREEDGRIDVVKPADGERLELDDRRVILNPGGVGQPRDGDPRACAMLLDTDGGTAEWRRIEYPVAEVQESMRAAGLPERLIRRLEAGL
jgi:diadenosine tetraphosphatase ApaH/serine/threonine PP2A family protein phosphatase